MRRALPLRDRFVCFIRFPQTREGCWEWMGTKNPNDGHGYVREGGRGSRVRKVHRVAYELFVGPIPKSDGHWGTCVFHHCHNPACVNPEHLYLGRFEEVLTA